MWNALYVWDKVRPSALFQGRCWCLITFVLFILKVLCIYIFYLFIYFKLAMDDNGIYIKITPLELWYYELSGT